MHIRKRFMLLALPLAAAGLGIGAVPVLAAHAAHARPAIAGPVTPSPDTRTFDIRHAYLHYLLDPLATRHQEILDRKKSLVDHAMRAQALIEENLVRCGIAEGYAIIRESVERALDTLRDRALSAPFDLVLLDPPYNRRPGGSGDPGGPGDFGTVLAAAGIEVRWSVTGVVGTLAMLMLGTAAFACMSMLLAAAVKERERFMGIGQLIMMPLFFASSALYPLSVMPGWLRVVARVNPLTYEVQGLRQMLVGVGGAGEVWLDFLVVAGFFAAMLIAATRAYPKAIL